MKYHVASHIRSDWLSAGVLVIVTTAIAASHARGAAPRLSVDEPKIDLGTVQAGDVVPMLWRLENTGDADLVIERIKPGCGCTIVSFSEEDQIIHPGDTLELEAAFNSTGRRGEHDKEVVIFSNDPNQPKFGLSFRAYVDRLFEVVPNSLVDLRTVQRGSTAARTIDVVEDRERGEVTIVGIDVPDDTPLDFSVKPFHETRASGKRIAVTVLPSAATGKLKVKATLRIQLGDTIREHTITIRVEVVGEITWLPRIVDSTRRKLRPGNTLAPVSIRTSSGPGFRVLRATGGDIFDVSVEPQASAGPAKRHIIKLKVREGVRPGPFGVTLHIETDAPDQPVIEIPVYGFVMAPLGIDPPIVLLRQDGTPAGTVRQLRFMAYPGTPLNITSYESRLQGVSVQPPENNRKTQRHIRYLEVRLAESLPSGPHTTTITVTTNIPGFDRVEIPVKVEAVE